jgi:hypothetical protein
VSLLVAHLLDIAVPTVCLGGYAAVIGLAARFTLCRWLRLPAGLGLTIGIGLSVAAFVVVLFHVMFDNAVLPVAPLAVLAIGVVGYHMVHERGRRRRSLRRVLTRARAAAPVDIIAGFASVLALVPILGEGLAYWTSGIADFPSYASSAEIWLTSVGEFSAKHPDAFGALQVGRAGHEKPIVTAVLLAASYLSRVPPYQLLTPVTLIFIFTYLSSALALARTFRPASFGTTVAVLVPALSIIPMSRVYDSQLGQVAAIAFLSCTLALLAAQRPILRGLPPLASGAALGALLGVAAVGSNATLVIGSGPTLAALLLWLIVKQSVSPSFRLWLAGLCGIFAALLAFPFMRMFIASFRNQTGGEQGGDIPLASPLGAIGQQLTLWSTTEQSQTLLSWTVILLATLLGIWASPSTSRWSRIADASLLVAVVGNAMLVGLRLGWANYAVHKWFALAIAAVVPLVLAYGISRLRGRVRVAGVALLSGLLVSSAWISLSLGLAIKVRLGTDLFELRTNEQLADLASVNVHLDGLQKNMIAALVVPTSSVILTKPTYAAASPPRGNHFLLQADQVDSMQHTVATKLNDTYSLVTVDLTISSGATNFTNGNPEARRHLYGKWSAAEVEGTWSGGRDNYVVLDLPPELRHRDLRMRIVGHAFANEKASQTIWVFVNDHKLVEKQYPADKGGTVEVVVPSDVSEAVEGRLVVNLQSRGTLSPADFGSRDGRQLAFKLVQLEILPAQD